jgi:hypothetical protein
VTNAERSKNALDEAIYYFGGVIATARAVKMTTDAFRHAVHRGRLSGTVSRRVHDLTGGIIHRESLRPDLFPTRTERERNIDKLIAALRDLYP